MYRDAFENLKAVKAEVDYLDRLVEQSRTKLLTAFEDWFALTYAPPADDTAAATGARGLGDDDETRYMDDQERFDRMEAERIMNENPDSLAFYNARKTLRERAKATATATRSPTRQRPGATMRR